MWPMMKFMLPHVFSSCRPFLKNGNLGRSRLSNCLSLIQGFSRTSHACRDRVVTRNHNSLTARLRRSTIVHSLKLPLALWRQVPVIIRWYHRWFLWNSFSFFNLIVIISRWEEEKKNDGTKWHFLEHKGPVFAPDYEPLPRDVRFYYNGKEMKLSQDTEEVATFYARMLDHDYTTKKIFNNNFFQDWRDVMTESERTKIMDLSKCNFKEMHAYFLQKSEERKAMSKEEKKKIKEQNEEIQKEYGFCTIDGHKEKIGNFKIEPPGLFRGRGEHPKMGKLKKRVRPCWTLCICLLDNNS